MKKKISQLSLILTLLLILSLIIIYSCSKNEQSSDNSGLNARTDPWYVTYNGVTYEVMTPTQVTQFYNQTGLYLNEDPQGIYTCKWSDGGGTGGGTITCNGGHCKLIRTQDANGNITVCIACFNNNDEMQHAGSCRPGN